MDDDKPNVEDNNNINFLGDFKGENVLWINSRCFSDRYNKMTIEILCIVNIHRQLRCVRRSFTSKASRKQTLKEEKI